MSGLVSLYEAEIRELNARIEALEATVVAAWSMREMSEWQPIETAPINGNHQRGMWVYSHATGEPIYWTADYGYVDSDGDFCYAGGDQTGWRAEDYTHWMPLPKPPEP